MTNKIEVKNSTQSLFESLLIMAAVVEARDAYTGGHLWRVSQFSRILALELGLSLQDSLEISLGGFLHDLGKIGIPDAILNKKGKLTEYEYEVIKTHPDIGAKLIELHPLSHFAIEAISYHHERPDGMGYPNGLKKEKIPLVARIVGICDAFDAMTSTRPYREGMPIEKALAILQEKAREREFMIPYDVAEFIAANVTSNVRELEGAFKRVIAIKKYRGRNCG